MACVKLKRYSLPCTCDPQGDGFTTAGRDRYDRASGRSRGGADPRQEQQQQMADQEAQQAEIMRLLTCLKTLGDENLSLMKECEDRDKVCTALWCLLRVR